MFFHSHGTPVFLFPPLHLTVKHTPLHITSFHYTIQAVHIVINSAQPCMQFNFTLPNAYLLLKLALQPLVGFPPAELPLSILSRKVLQSAVASGTSNPQLGGPGI
jgi:hypothetical protein